METIKNFCEKNIFKNLVKKITKEDIGFFFILKHSFINFSSIKLWLGLIVVAIKVGKTFCILSIFHHFFW